jgi:hypothetical protein
MSKSNYLENALLRHVFGGPDYVRPTTLYVALYSSDPTDAGTGTELTGGGYSRASVVNSSSSWSLVSDGIIQNAETILYPQVTSTWVTALYAGVLDEAVGGNLLYHGALSFPFTGEVGLIPAFTPGSIRFLED